MPNREKILKAAALIREAIAELDTNSSICECCGLTKYDNRQQQQAHVELEAVIKKLNRWSNVFDEKAL